MRAALGARLCPYDGELRRLLRGTHHEVWGTRLAETVGESARCSLHGGTAAFEVRVESDRLVVSTDPLGTCPIWYAEARDGWVAATEVKALCALAEVRLRPDDELTRSGSRPADWSPFAGALRLPPGARLVLGPAGPRVVGAPRRFEVTTSDEGELALWADQVGARLRASFAAGEEPGGRGPLGALVSGGIDSSTACALARRPREDGRHERAVATFTLGTQHGDEFAPAAAVARSLGCVHGEVSLERDAARALFDRVVFEAELCDGLTAEVAVQLAALLDAARERAECVVTGYGSDLLFDGMLRVAPYMEAVGLSTTSDLIERTRWTGELAPFVGWARGVALRHVFWEPDVIDVALRVPRALCFRDGVEKVVLREAAVRAGILPRELAFQPKVGLSEGTGANRLLCEALGIPGALGYAEKSAAAAARLREVIAWAGSVG